MKLLKQTHFTWAVVLLFAATNAFGGGFMKNGGSNGNVTLSVTNSSSSTVGVYYDSTNTAIQSAITNNNPTAFTNAGGVILNPGGKTSFSIKPGTYSFVAVPDSVNRFFMPVTSSISILAGHTPSMDIITNGNTVSLNFSP